MFVTQCLERSLHRIRATPATAPVWDDLRVLLAVHRGKSFLSASKALDVATSTVARRIEAFERALGRPLVLSGNRGTAIDADAPSLIALAKQMELGFDALLRAPDAPPLDHIDAITISPYADEAYEQQARAATESMDPSAAGRIELSILSERRYVPGF